MRPGADWDGGGKDNGLNLKRAAVAPAGAGRTSLRAGSSDGGGLRHPGPWPEAPAGRPGREGLVFWLSDVGRH